MAQIKIDPDLVEHFENVNQSLYKLSNVNSSVSSLAYHVDSAITARCYNLKSILINGVDGNSNSLTFTVEQLGKENGKLYFSLQRGNDIPSMKVE